MFDITNYAPAIKETVSGGTAICKNVSPLKHNLDVRVKSKNLIPFPYLQSTKKLNGITVTANGDGSVSAIGTATADTTIYFDLCEKDFGTTNMYSGFIYAGEYAVKDCTYDAGNKKTYISISVKNGEEINNTYYPQIELGSTATPYTPYTSEFEGVEVSRYGKNLFNLHCEKSTKLCVPNTYVVGATRNNRRNPNAITELIIEDNNLTITTYTGYYGVGFFLNLEPDTDYIISCDISDVKKASIGVGFYDNDWSYISDVSSWQTDYLYIKTPVDSGKVNICLTPTVAKTSITFFNIQLELGSTVTEYEPYKQPQTATANTDGTVEGLTSVSPSMTLLADNNVIIDCTYNKNTKAYINEKVSTLSVALLEV